eukprot:TRINITY_DN11550_c0_g1_i1.p1 TRINITY_DN11550_c0_g1~~TRINITY_DN11550_c0_g1_i1.p1  ORF type:complete len:399 (+),score=36.95 TRINITY_DN11550_c0_g1_i1:162-1358(+)
MKKTTEAIHKPTATFKPFAGKRITGVIELHDGSVLIGAEGRNDIQRWRARSDSGGTLFVHEQSFELSDKDSFPIHLLSINDNAFLTLSNWGSDLFELWDLATGSNIHKFAYDTHLRAFISTLKYPSSIESIKSYYDGNIASSGVLLVGDYYYSIGIWILDLKRGGLDFIGSLGGNRTTSITAICEMEGGLLASASHKYGRHKVEVWDLTSFKVLRTLDSGYHQLYLRSIDIVEVKPRFLALARGDIIKCWQIDDNNINDNSHDDLKLAEFDYEIESMVKQVRLNPETKETKTVLITSHKNCSVIGTDSESGDVVFSCESISNSWANSLVLCVSRVDDSVYCGFENGTVKRWRTHSSLVELCCMAVAKLNHDEEDLQAILPTDLCEYIFNRSLTPSSWL